MAVKKTRERTYIGMPQAKPGATLYLLFFGRDISRIFNKSFDLAESDQNSFR